ncbi:MAG: caspase family protein [Deltaproteobacteria bacterium]|nr:caspase family protein [Deltaproteobacteria bacterium]
MAKFFKLLSATLFFITYFMIPGLCLAENYESYALLIGSSKSDDGSNDLKYAIQDAFKMGETLINVGRFEKKNISTLYNPSADEIKYALVRLKKILAAQKSLDVKTRFFFYYSGHGKQDSLVLGKENYPLAKLRKELLELPSTVKLIILDACHTGEFSHVKGVTASKGFSSDFMDGLNVEGTAVIASSSGTELSQESVKLKGSYFSHHFNVGLRGAADEDKNGTVSLLEAYRYAYNRTLGSTALTEVGRQHATLEMDLKGKGDMILSWPSEINSKLLLDTTLEGSILVMSKSSDSVSADIRKAKGDAFTVTLKPDDYTVTVKDNSSKIYVCDIKLKTDQITQLKLNKCKRAIVAYSSAKGRGTIKRVDNVKPLRREHLFAEFSIGYFHGGASEYTDRLNDFGYTSLDESKGLTANLSIVATPLPWISIGFTVANMDNRSGDNNLTGVDQSVSWTSMRYGGFLRGNLLLNRGFIVPYVQFGGGGAKAVLTLDYTNESGDGTSNETFKSGYLSIGGGLQINLLKWFGITILNAEYIYAPVLHMQGVLDEKHNNGGFALTTGVRFGY